MAEAGAGEGAAGEALVADEPGKALSLKVLDLQRSDAPLWVFTYPSTVLPCWRVT